METKVGLKWRSECGGPGGGLGRDEPGLTRPVLPSYRHGTDPKGKRVEVFEEVQGCRQRFENCKVQ